MTYPPYMLYNKNIKGGKIMEKHIDFASNPVELPASIAIALEKNPRQGVAVLYYDENSKKWVSRVLDASRFNQGLLSHIVKEGKFNDNSSDTIILDLDGNVLFSNSKREVTKDANNFAHIGNDEYLVKFLPEIKDNCAYVCGKDLDYINFTISRWIQLGFIEKPKGFGNDGLIKKPISQDQPTGNQPGEE